MGIKNVTTFDKTDLSHILVVDEYEFLYCYIPKIACTNWKRTILGLSGKIRTLNSTGIKHRDVHYTLSPLFNKLNQYPEAEIKYRINNYLKFIVVRDPLERIISAYNDKFVHTKDNSWRNRYKRYRRKQNTKTHSSMTSSNTKPSQTLTFEDFFKLIINQNPKEHIDEHRDIFYKLCHPCHVEYDIIAKYYTFNEDVGYILEKANLRNLDFPKLREHNGPATKDLVARTLDNISENDIKKFMDVYSMDYRLFGYDLPR